MGVKTMHVFVRAAIVPVSVVLSFGQAAFAQSAQSDDGVVIVTASKLPDPQRNVTQQVSIVFSEDFDRIGTPQRNAAELMRYEPGMFVNPLSRNDANWGSYGGLGPKYNGLLLDGLPVDAFVDPMSIDPWALDRIESQRGPASVLYGNYLSMDFAGNQSPLAGISNFVLKDRIDSAATLASFGLGSWNTAAARLYHQDRVGNFNYFVGGSYEQSDYTGYGMPNSWLDTTKDPEYKKTKLYGKANWFLGRDDHTLSVFAQATRHEGDVGRPNRDYDHQYGLVNVTYANQLSTDVGVRAKVGWRDYDRRWSEDNYPINLSWNSQGSVKQRIVPADLSVNVAHGNGLLTAGTDAQWLDYRTYTDNGTTRIKGNDVEARSYGLFAQERMILGDWVLRVGARFNRTEHDYKLIGGAAPGISGQSWNKALWSAGVRYNLASALAFFGNAGTSFTPPSAKSVGGTILESDLGVIGKNGQLPNPNLRPESGRAFDIGMDVRPVKGMTLVGRLFLNKVDDAIVENVVSAVPSQTRSVNAGNARSHGIELSMRHSPDDRVNYFANTTFTRSRITNPLDAKQDGADLSFVPKNVTNLGLNVRLSSNTSLSPYIQYVGKYYDSTDKTTRRTFGDYAVLNMRITHRLMRNASQEVELYADLNNLGNRKYEMPWMFRDVGFNGMVGVQARF
jgi:outer membrane receptor protein involved in Fe transport